MNKMLYAISIALVVSGCNDSDKNTVKPIDQAKPVEVPKKLASDFTSISPLYLSPYTVTATEYVEEAKTINILELKRGQLSCAGECELPITGYTPIGQGSTMFSIGTDTILTDIMINASTRSSICYEMQSGWFVVQYFYRGEVTYKESQNGCYSYLIDTVVESWMDGVVISANADIRGSSMFTISER